MDYDALEKRLREPPFGTETSERNLMMAAADAIADLRAQLDGDLLKSQVMLHAKLVTENTDFTTPATRQDMVGNVYPVRGGFGARNGHMHIIIAAYDKVVGCCRYNGCATITVDRDGDIVGGNNCALHYFDSEVPMARCDGLDQIQLVIRSL